LSAYTAASWTALVVSTAASPCKEGTECFSSACCHAYQRLHSM
jgi:hypothetical protein